MHGRAVLAAASFLLGTMGCFWRRPPIVLVADESLVGRRFAGEIEGSRTHVARLINTPGDREYALHHITLPSGDRLIITRIVGQPAGARTEYEILAAAKVPRLHDDERLIVAACALNGRTDVDIVAVARLDDSAQLDRIRAAWMADGPLARLDIMSTDGITCEHEGWKPR